MILVDTSVWVDHFRRRNRRLIEALDQEFVLTHPLVITELACGNLKNRPVILAGLDALPQAAPPTDREVLELVEGRKLWGRRLGAIDVHLLASALLSHCRLWTLDRKLRDAAAAVGVALPKQV